jgi:hypothetical protein
MGKRRAFALGVGAGLCVAAVGIVGFMIGSSSTRSDTDTRGSATAPQPANMISTAIAESSVRSSTTVVVVTSTSRALVPVEFTDSALLIQVANERARSLMGRRLSPSELDPFVDYFHEQEVIASASLNAGVDFTRPDPTGQADLWIRTNFGEEVAAYATLQAYDDLIDIITGDSTTSTTTCDPIIEFCT